MPVKARRRPGSRRAALAARDVQLRVREPLGFPLSESCPCLGRTEQATDEVRVQRPLHDGIIALSIQAEFGARARPSPRRALW